MNVPHMLEEAIQVAAGDRLLDLPFADTFKRVVCVEDQEFAGGLRGLHCARFCRRCTDFTSWRKKLPGFAMTDLKPMHRLRIHEDPRGRLVSVEGSTDLPFEIKRVYYILPHDDHPRGFHAHKALQQLMICVTGSCRIVLDDGSSRSEHVLNRPDEGLFVDRMTWREMHDFTSGAVLLVLASERFDEDDYIRDYNNFLEAAKNQEQHAR